MPPSWRWTIVSVALLSLLEPWQTRGATTVHTNELAFLEPWFAVERQDRDTLTRRGVVTHGLPASNRQISIIALCADDISADEVVAGASALGYVKRDELVSERFSEPPTAADLAPLTLDQGDIDRVRVCRPGKCALNLADGEISDLQRAITRRPESPAAVQDAFRHVILSRLKQYRSGGLAALPEYHDRSNPVQPAAVFSDILEQMPYLRVHLPAVAAYLKRFPLTDTTGKATSLHWSKVIVNNKPVVVLTHLTTFQPEPGPQVPAVLTVSSTVYASRYLNGELTLWMLFASGDGSSYLVYVTRSELDTLGGTFDGLKRAAIEGRMKEAAAGALVSLRDRLER